MILWPPHMRNRPMSNTAFLSTSYQPPFCESSQKFVLKKENMKSATKPISKTPRTMDLRDRLKVLIERELDGLPELLDGLNGKERLDAILKLMPIVMPRAKSVRYDVNEPMSWG
jgi:hypothetical protein